MNCHKLQEMRHVYARVVGLGNVGLARSPFLVVAQFGFFGGTPEEASLDVKQMICIPNLRCSLWVKVPIERRGNRIGSGANSGPGKIRRAAAH